MLAMELGQRVIKARQHAKLTQAQLAGRVRISQQTLSRLESGKNAGSSKLTEIALECGVSPAWLAREDGPMIIDRHHSGRDQVVSSPQIDEVGTALALVAQALAESVPPAARALNDALSDLSPEIRNRPFVRALLGTIRAELAHQDSLHYPLRQAQASRGRKRP